MKNKRNKSKAANIKGQSKALIEFRQNLYNKHDFRPRRLFHQLQTFGEYDDMVVISKYFSNSSNIFHSFIFGTPFAKSYAQARTERYFISTKDLERDLDWMSLSITRYAPEISRFVEESILYQRCFLLGFYDQAKSILGSIISEFGYSLWTLEKSLLLAECSSGLESNKKMLSMIMEDSSVNVILQFLAEYLSRRCETKISTENYRLSMGRGLEVIENYPGLYSYLRYRLDNIGYDHINTDKITFFEGASPVIDRYLTYMAILQACAISEQQYNVAERNVVRMRRLVKDIRMDALAKYLQ